MHVDPDFIPLLRRFEHEGLEVHASPICGLWPNLRIAYVNPAWGCFALENGANTDFISHWGIGRSLPEAIVPALRSFYVLHYQHCLKTGKPWRHNYECSSPEQFRLFRHEAFSIAGDGLVVVHSLRIERPHDREIMLPFETNYREVNGLIRQCAYCRRTCRAGNHNAWDWVPEYVRHPPERLTHGICPPCAGYYFEMGLSDDQLPPS